MGAVVSDAGTTRARPNSSATSGVSGRNGLGATQFRRQINLPTQCLGVTFSLLFGAFSLRHLGGGGVIISQRNIQVACHLGAGGVSGQLDAIIAHPVFQLRPGTQGTAKLVTVTTPAPTHRFKRQNQRERGANQSGHTQPLPHQQQVVSPVKTMLFLSVTVVRHVRG